MADHDLADVYAELVDDVTRDAQTSGESLRRCFFQRYAEIAAEIMNATVRTSVFCDLSIRCSFCTLD